MATPRIALPVETLADFCRQNRIQRLALFGSVLRDDFHAGSDIDVLVDFEPHVQVTFALLDQLESKLSSLFGRKVDMGEWQGVREDPNYIRREAILGSLQVIYER